MKDAPEDPPIGYAEFRIQGKDGLDVFTAKAYTYTDLAKIVGFMPVGLMFEVHLDLCWECLLSQTQSACGKFAGKWSVREFVARRVSSTACFRYLSLLNQVLSL